MTSRRLLVVSGDYGVVQQVKQVLGGRNFSIHPAYSHLDAIYQLRYEQFDLVVVDATMSNHNSGEKIAVALSELAKHPPLLVYAPNNSNGHWAKEIIISSLDNESLTRGIARALRMPLPNMDGERTLEQPAAHHEVESTSVFWRDDEMQTLFALARSLAEVLDLSEVLNRVVEAARRLTNAEEGMILLPDGQSGQLYLRAKVGIDSEVADNFRIRTHDTIAGTVFEEGRPILVGESGPQKVKTEYFVNSLLYVPIIHKGQTLGVLGVNNKVKHDVFTQRHSDLLINLATYAAVGIENARVHGQSVRRANELKALVDASQAINESLALEQTLPAICTQFARVLNVGHAEIHTWDAHKRQLLLMARYQEASWREGHQPLFRLVDRPSVQLAFAERHHVVVSDEMEQDRLRQAGASSLLVVPVFGGERPLGALQAYYVHELDLVPSHDMIARVQRLMLEGLVSYSSGGDGVPVFKLLREAKAVLEADWLEYVEYVAASASLKQHFSLGVAVWLTDPRPVIDVADYPDVLATLEKQQALNHFQSEDNLPSGAMALADITGSRSLLGLPLVGRGQTMGMVLFADSLHARAFSSREIDLGRAIVGQAATALENNQLFHDLEASLRDLRDAQTRLVQGARLSAMGELAAAVAHQINNPLTTIVLDTELLLETRSRDSKEYEILSAISRQGKRAAGVVRRLLTMARPLAEDTPHVAVNVIDTITDVTALVRSHVEREGIRLITDLPETLPRIWAMPGELDDIWLNLILNAHDAVIGCTMPEIGVDASYDRRGNAVEVNVWDNGPGIPPEIVGEIFKPFFTTKPLGEGTGLGLHICRQVVDRVGGSISVQTSSSGTRFVVRLPIMRSS